MSDPSNEVLQAIPHRPPMLLIDAVLERSSNRIVCCKTVHPDEFFLQGHYPGMPVVPGVILCEMGMQAGAILLSHQVASELLEKGRVPVATRLENVKFKRMVRPGDVVMIEVDLKEQLAAAFFLVARLTLAGSVVCRFEFACTLANAGDLS